MSSIVMYFETIPTITTSRSLSKLARGIQDDQVYFLPKKYVDPSSSSDNYQKLLKSATFFSTCFMFHSLGAIVALPRYPDPVYF